MKTIVIGDIHGNPYWEDIIEQEKNFDRLIFVGDYFDSFDVPYVAQMQNFKNIIQFKEENKDKVILLLGNHDYHYLPEINESYSGFQNKSCIDISIEMHKNIMNKNIQMCFYENHVLYSHAGITKTWCENNNIKTYYLPKTVAEINDYLIYKPKVFRFVGGNLYGDSIESSPIWVREKSLIKDRIYPHTMQIIGHTAKYKLEIQKKLVIVDTLNTSGEYLVIEDKKLHIKTISNLGDKIFEKFINSK